LDRSHGLPACLSGREKRAIPVIEPKARWENLAGLDGNNPANFS